MERQVTAQTATPMTEAFNLRHAIRDYLAGSDEMDPNRIADAVMKQIPRSAYGRVIRELLRGAVVDEMGEQRRRAMSSKPSPVTPGRSRFHGWKARQGDQWLKALRAPVKVGDSAFKALGECTADDLDYAARHRYDLASANRVQARKFEAYRDAVVENGVTTFGELPAEVRLRLLGGAE